MQRNYNYIYSKLVENENDIVGHIAYSLYKSQKIQHIQDHKSKHGKDPLDQELVSFNDFSSSKASLESYKLKAGLVLQQFINEALEETIEEMEDSVTRNQANILRDIITPVIPPSLKSQFWIGVGQNIVAGLALSLLFALLIIILQAQDKGIENVIEETFDLEISKKQQKVDTVADSAYVKPN